VQMVVVEHEVDSQRPTYAVPQVDDCHPQLCMGIELRACAWCHGVVATVLVGEGCGCGAQIGWRSSRA
jgi:hypothetical protein